MIEITYLLGIYFHKYVIPHLKYGQWAAEKEAFNTEYIILIV